MKNYLIYSTLLLLITNVSNAISKGRPVQQDTPLASTIYFKNLKEGICAGVVIANNAILTAAHCIHPSIYSSNIASEYMKTLILLSGFNSQSEKNNNYFKEETFLDRVTVHESYIDYRNEIDNKWMNGEDFKERAHFEHGVIDLAIIHLKTTTTITPAIIDSEDLKLDDEIYITGAGTKSGKKSKGYINYALKKVVKLDDFYFRVSSKNAGTSKKRKRSKLQPGDSGGGAYIKKENGSFKLIGINSQLLGLFYKGHGSIVNLTEKDVREWIIDNL